MLCDPCERSWTCFFHVLHVQGSSLDNFCIGCNSHPTVLSYSWLKIRAIKSERISMPLKSLKFDLQISILTVGEWEEESTASIGPSMTCENESVFMST